MMILRMLGWLVLGLLGLAVGVVILPTAIVLILGMAVPALVILAMPLRAAFLAVMDKDRARFLFLALLLPWAYFLWPILQRGYVSESSRGTGPTVNPWVWTCLGIAWLILELVRRNRQAVNSVATEAHGEDV